ncbi:hypothetical protein CKM354_000520200 [Cercospora kikuchii]|uniref:Uncharacterized protein n=1 Tax=Cercospora kikuchii TaxID=84275 RepID=A0A9P3CIB9_9PEZI|nr:uncharacterized protein CKM354_000520200 [Cercospora kikuchii]GIZ41917.1 hypothetical protein CKM354_000520200 [Cercospora kikuchii]
MEPTDDKKSQEARAREIAEAEQRLVFERERSLDNAEEVDGVWRERLAPTAELERLKEQWKEQGLPGPSLNNTPFSPYQAAGYLHGLGAVPEDGTRRHRLNPRATPFVPSSPPPTINRQKQRRDSEQTFYTASEAAASTDSFHSALEPTIVSEGDEVAGKSGGDQRE